MLGYNILRDQEDTVKQICLSMTRNAYHAARKAWNTKYEYIIFILVMLRNLQLHNIMCDREDTVQHFFLSMFIKQ